ncbi:MAG: flotillin family protein, partial [Candidatus Flemingiibacterium sp.]
RASLEQATLEADIIVKAEIEKKQAELKAEAEAEQIRRRAKGEADATLMRMQAEADGMRSILTKQAEGFAELVKSAGGESNDAVRMMIADKLEELTKIQVEAVKNLKIDKVTVWDGGKGEDGKTATANFVSGLMKTIPPMNELFDMAGMNLPTYLGSEKKDAGADSDSSAPVQNA